MYDFKTFIPRKVFNSLIFRLCIIGLETGVGATLPGFKSPLSANHSTKSITYKAFLILSCINPCIKIPFSRSIFLTTDAVFTILPRVGHPLLCSRVHTLNNNLAIPRLWWQNSWTSIVPNGSCEDISKEMDCWRMDEKKWNQESTGSMVWCWTLWGDRETHLQHFYVEVERRILAYRMLLSRNTIPTFNRLMLDDYRNKILSGEIFSVVIPLLLDMSLPEPTQ